MVANVKSKLRILHEKLDANNKCFVCPNFHSRRKLSIQILKMVSDICNLCQHEFFVVGLDHPHPPVLVNLTSNTSVNIPSRELLMKDVMKVLEDDTISSIGVHGMGGIGKTTLMNRVNSELRESRLFMKVIMVTVSKDPDLMVIQDRIAERLNLHLGQNSSPYVRANKLFQRLMAEKSVLIILDDMWQRLEVVEMGLPNGNEHLGCKVLLTTRDLDVCRHMQVQKMIKMEILSDEESWMIFEEKVGDAVNIPNLHLIGKEIVRRCNGSPLAIAVLGSTLKNVPDEFVWSHALNVLRHPNAMGLEGIMPEVVTSLRLSFDHLPNLNVKLCFLYCFMFPQDEIIELSTLRSYGIGDSFLNMTATVENASNELMCFIKILKEQGFLLDGYDEMSVKMHDVVRDVSMLIASEDNYGFFASVGGGSNYQPLPGKSNAIRKILIMDSEEYVLPNPLKYPLLRTFLIRYVPVLPVVDDNFLFECQALRVLVLDMWEPLRVPKSVSQLANLRTLYSQHCDLRNRVFLGGLAKIEVLVMNNSILGDLVEEFGNLINLRILDLEDAEIDYIAPGIFSRLRKLEELNMLNDFDKWGSVGREDQLNAGFVEVTTLAHLFILNITAKVVEEDAMPNFHWLNKLKEFHVALNYNWNKRDLLSSNNIVHIKNSNLGNHGNSMYYANSKRKPH